MLTSRRRPEAPPPPKTTSVADPLAPTTQEWREAEREKAARRKAWALRAALALSLPFLAGGVYAFPLAYLWRVLCVRVPVARRWGVLWAPPALAAVYLFPAAVLGPTRDLALLPATAGPLLPVAEARVLALPGVPAELGLAAEVATADPFPPLRAHLTASWLPGLVWGALLCAGWGVGGWLEGAKLRPRTPAEVVRAAERTVKRKPSEVERGLMLRGYLTMFFAKQGTGKTEYACWLILTHPEVSFYWLSEQTDTTLEPYLKRWGLVGARNLHIETREEANKLWRRHGHDTEATWDYLGPMVLDDAGRRGADIFIMDTWTAWTDGAQDQKSIRAAMAPIRAAVDRWRYGVFVCGHTNKEGELLGSKEFERLCDISVGGEVVEGTKVRRLWWVKDRSPNKYPDGHSLYLMRDVSGPLPCYRAPTPEELSGGGVGGSDSTSTSGGFGGDTRRGLVDLSSQRHPVGRRLRKAGAEGCTVAQLTEASGLTQQAVSLWLKAREQDGQCERFAKRGNADLWRWAGVEQEAASG